MAVERSNTRWNGWGWTEQPDELTHNDRVWDWMAQTLGMEALLATPPVPLEDILLPRTMLPTAALNALSEVVGEGWVKLSREERASHARGKSYHDLLYLRAGDLTTSAPDAVVYPGDPFETLEVVQRCADLGVAVIPTGGGTSVVGGVTAFPGEGHSAVIVLDTTRMNRVLTIDEEAMTAVVEAGIYGPDLEAQLAEHGYTLGHYPQSFEFSTLGGWIAARGAGQQSGKYGKAENWLVCAKLATPKGFWTTECFPASAAGPDMNDLVLGSEGTLGVITEATVKIHRMPEAKDYRGYLFNDFASGVAAAREIVQARLPVAMVRLSDENETHFFRAFSDAQKRPSPLRGIKKMLEALFLKLKRVSKTPCLMIVGAEGRKDGVNAVSAAAETIARKHKAVPLGPSAGKRWYESRFHGPYARDPMLDHGLGVDTLETATRWSNILHLHEAMVPALEGAIRETLPHEAAHGIVMGHISHTYADGASLYYTYVFPRDLEAEVPQWLSIKKAATETIVEHGGTISHHHGVGTDHSDWMIEEKGPIGVGVLRAIKDELDTAGVMNPGKLID
jgi:alkyldihydroxyacetonephosphate synthase